MLDKLIEVILTFIDDLLPVKIVKTYEEGVKLRFGLFIKDCKPGLHFKIPFIEEVITAYSKDDTILLPSQKLTTKDGKTITTRGMILYYVDDITLFLLSVNNPTQALSDLTMGIISENIINGLHIDCHNDKIMNEISKSVRREAKKWGCYIIYVKLTDISLSKSLNLFNEGESHL